MTSNAPRNHQHASSRRLFLAFELGLATWKLAFATHPADRPRVRNIPARDLERLMAEIDAARKAFSLSPRARVLSCYEAGRDGFWLHRFLEHATVANVVIDPSSLQVDRRGRHAKTDRLDVHRLLGSLMRHATGERRVWSVVNVPSPADEDARHLHRSRVAIRNERTRHVNRIKGLLMTQGIRIEAVPKDLRGYLDRVRLWDGSEVPAGLRARLEEEWHRWQLANRQLLDLEAEQRRIIRESDEASIKMVTTLMALRGIGPQGAWTLVTEFFAWRRFRNRRQVGACAGFVPVPHQSGEEDRDRGISKAGNRHVRGLMVDLAWQWLRWQPRSHLSRWYEKRFGNAGPRMRKIGIVALARKLLISLWRLLDTGLIPEGAVLAA